MAEAERPVWLIKLALFHATLGPSPGPWSEWGAHGGELYAELLRRIDAAAAGARSLGLAPRVRLVCMMQGESDALDPALAAVYGRYLEELVRQLRSDLVVRELADVVPVPFRIGLVNPHLSLLGFPAVAAVREAQQRVAQVAPSCVAIETAGLPLQPDGVHFSVAGTLWLGRAFVTPLPW